MLFMLLVTVVLMGLGMRLYDLTAAVSVVITVADVLVGVVFLSTVVLVCVGFGGVLSPTQPINKKQKYAFRALGREPAHIQKLG